MKGKEIGILMCDGIATGLVDSNGKGIKSGDNIRYEYMVGFTRIKLNDGKERKAHCVPFDESEETFHETVMKYQINKNSAGFFLDLPKGISFAWFTQTLKYYVV